MSAPAYQPIACADHERLEFAALTRQWMELTVEGTVQLRAHGAENAVIEAVDLMVRPTHHYAEAFFAAVDR